MKILRLFLLLFLPLLAQAQQYPSRPITLVVPFAPGGGTDSLARELAKLMQDKLGQAVVVDNRGGAGGAIAAAQAAQSGINHLAGELFVQRTGAKMTHVPYKGSGPATMDLIGGQAQVFFATVPTILGQVKGGKVRLIAATSVKRSALFPDVPTVQESGVRDFAVETWWGIVGPAQLPTEIVAKLNEAINASAQSPEMKKRFVDEGADPFVGQPGDLATQLTRELEGWRRVVRDSGLKID